MAKKAASKTEVALPYSFTDMAKAVNEAADLAERAAKWIGSGLDLYNTRKSKKAAQNLSELAFGPQGTRKHLERIASGQGTKADLAAVGAQLETTAERVEQSIGALNKYRDRLRERDGMAAMQKLDEIVYGPVGKRALRLRLRELAEMGREQEPSQDQIAALAKDALSMIAKLNKDLASLHDSVIGLAAKRK
ncbi:hypothetical protein [Hyphomicrobium sp.]|uniref:hypothetical protein n=1 Tax=Hyphomicrobium sp. TaxID=82 RepID=UPI0025C41DB7|nr:hypothetical protein [Hyphomicrobium sp.]MCC7252373.1 hypothetical protein [Hyphomicrobium sp.]